MHLHLSSGDSVDYARKREEFGLIPSIASLYWSSVFCMQPVGDCCTRKVHACMHAVHMPEAVLRLC